MGFIYQLTFRDGRRYIGMTIKTVEIRFNQHKRKSKKGRSVLYVAWRELGDPSVEILAVIPDSDLPEAEQRFIRDLKTEFPLGYNTLPGGEVSPALCKLVAAKISKSRMGIVFSDEHILNLSLSHKGKPSLKKGKPMSEEQKQKLSDAWVLRRLTPEAAETRAKKSIASTGRRHTPEVCSRISEARKAYWATKRTSA